MFCPTGEIVAVANERGYRTAGSCPDAYIPLVEADSARAGDVVTLSAAGIAVKRTPAPEDGTPQSRLGASLAEAIHRRSRRAWGLRLCRTGRNN